MPTSPRSATNDPPDSPIPSDGKLRFILETCPVYIAYCGRDYRYRYVNQRNAARFGRRPEELIGHHIAESMGQTAFERIRPYIERALAGEELEYEVELDYESIGPRFVRAHYVPERGPDGTVDGWVAVVTDETERRDAIRAARATEAALRESRDVMSLAMRGGRMGAWARDIATNHVWWSRELEEICGLPPGGFEGSEAGFFEVVHEDDRAGVARAVEAALAARDDYAVEFRFWHASGELRWMEGRGRAVYGDDGRPVTLYGLGIDITQRKHAEEVLRESELRFRTLADSVPVLIWVNSLTGVEFVNRFYVEFSGLSLDDVQAGKWVERIHPEDLDTYMSRYRAAVDRRERFDALFRFVRADGEVRWLKSVGEPRFTDSGDLLGYIGCSFDITDDKRAEQLLREADRRKDEFLATLAHELRNPLAPIRNAVQILRLRDSNEQQLESARNIIDRQVRQMTRLVDDLLDVARITSDKIQLRKERFELASAVHDAVEAARPLIKASAHELTITLPPDAVHLDADPTRISQILLNLLNNAAKYTPRGGHIWLTAERDGQEVVVSVRDDGIGIAAHHVPHLFEMFSQVAPALERSQGGLGIGLALVRGLVALHGGSVEARSAGIGKGSEFIVRLPVANVAPLSPPEPGADAGAKPPEPRRRILVVDDNRDAADTLSMLLELMGHDVRSAHDGLEAVNAAAVFHPEVVLLDIGLPKMNGYEAARHIRDQPWGKHMTLVALTGWGQEDDKRRAAEAGFNRHLTKPIDPDILQATLTSALSERKG